MSWFGHRPLRVGLCGAAILAVGVTVYWAALPAKTITTDDTAAAGTAASAIPYHPTRQAARATPEAVTVPADAPGSEARSRDTEVDTVAAYAAQKYEILLDDLRALPGRPIEPVQQALLKRELLTGGNDAVALAQADAEIRALLSAADYATYEALRDSDTEQFKLSEYAGGVSNVAPLSAADRKAILKTKLAYKERFEQLIRDSGLSRSDLSPAEREYAYSVTSRAMQDYKRSYLQEVRQYLTNEEQFQLLSNYENTEFSAELEKLRPKANGG